MSTEPISVIADLRFLEKVEINPCFKESLETAISLLESMGWRDIESAPKDGQRILGLFGLQVEITSFWPDQKVWCGNFAPMTPTHWMPLPAALVVESALGSPEGVRLAVSESPPQGTDAPPVKECPKCGGTGCLSLSDMNMKHAICDRCAGDGKVSTPPAEWKLPAPPAGYHWHRSDGWTKEWLPSGWRPLLLDESVTNDDEYRFCGEYWKSFDGEKLDYPISIPSQFHRRTRRPLPLPVESPASQVPVEEKQGPRVDSEKMTDEILRRAFSERDSANRRVEELREECRKLNAQLHLTVKEREDEEVDAKRWEERFNEMLENRNELYTKLTESEKALTSLRALYAWVPCKERMPTEQDAVSVVAFRSQPVKCVRWCYNNNWGPTVGVGAWDQPIKGSTHWQRLSPLPTAPVVEDAQRKFSDWWWSVRILPDKYEACEMAWKAAFLAGQNSTKPAP